MYVTVLQMQNKRPVKDQGAAEETFFEVSRLKEADEDAESLSIYVKNLSWKTSDASLMKHFDGTVSAAAGSIRYLSLRADTHKYAWSIACGLLVLV